MKQDPSFCLNKTYSGLLCRSNIDRKIATKCFSSILFSSVMPRLKSSSRLAAWLIAAAIKSGGFSGAVGEGTSELRIGKAWVGVLNLDFSAKHSFSQFICWLIHMKMSQIPLYRRLFWGFDDERAGLVDS